MPEITVVHIGIITVAAVAGVIAGWIARGNRSTQEKTALNVMWQEQREAQRAESDRLLSQNKSLMEQVNQNRASHKDATNRAKELSGALKEAFARRDELQREINTRTDEYLSSLRRQRSQTRRSINSLNSRLILIVVIDNDRVGDNLLLEEQLRHSQNRQLQANKED